ncbi:trypsin-like peptidase domain-containing protein [Streptomyces goshikiensis]|uniref:VMAP-C domain-containing protein n=1 Tax=Streptomyces goshikiensis TaxID=1942 RepID=UPI00368656D6
MTRPVTGPAHGDSHLNRAFVTVLGRAGNPVGAGVLVTPSLILTCAHVVNSALGQGRFHSPVPSRVHGVRLRFPHLDRERELTGRVVPEMWRPPRSRASTEQPSPPAEGMLPYYGDLAVLELDTEAPAGSEPACFLAHRDGNEVVARWASGHPLPTLRAVPRVDSHPWIALDVLGGTVAEGFSGGPLWDRERQAVVGLVVAAHDPAILNEALTLAPRRQQAPSSMYAIGISSIETEMPGLPPLAVPAAGRGRQQLHLVLEELLPSRQAIRECEERLAASLGRQSAGAAADIERLVGLAMGVRRGVPELLNIVYDQIREHRPSDPAQESLWLRALQIARLVSPGERLSPGQHRNLTGLLSQCRQTDPVSLLHKVLPYADTHPMPCDLADATDVLEGYDPQPSQPMPPLLQGVVHISTHQRVVGSELADDLDAWARSVAPRLGVARVALDQYGADIRAAQADRVSKRSPDVGPPRVQVELLPVPPGGLFTYQIWVWSAENRHEIVQTQDTEVPSTQVVEAILQVLRTEVHEYPENAVVEFFLAPGWLRLDVDAWEFPGKGDDVGFHPGIARRVVLRSSVRTRETYAGWKRRSSALSAAPRLLIDERHVDASVARARLEVHPEAGVVILCCGQQDQGRVLRQCIQAGVHTVLWHREGYDSHVAADMLALVESVDPVRIPEEVRMARAKARADPDYPAHFGKQLSLLHDGPDHRPPPLAPDSWVLTQP